MPFLSDDRRRAFCLFLTLSSQIFRRHVSGRRTITAHSTVRYLGAVQYSTYTHSTVFIRTVQYN